ncbi:hypothetical protein BD847_0613 [Flavobacterium cutihirudinis]|uniref:Uncharacterized protein n=1 Tax=Flavobacterium cutihirudinis TaxID=1265740 RepID=A0A3D9G0D7_9FLAO|nr:hypothetical protein [Flavobacterium cutihirudinis]RED26691.1 hypothetical protein BD847_0613 [Flavobacterium cutihirudinis]
MNLKIVFLILFNQYLIAQNKPDVYVNYTKQAVENMSDVEFISQSTFCEIDIFSNSTFRFISRPYISCLTWREIKGNWEKNNDIYKFLSQYEVIENDLRFKFKSDTTQKYLLKFKTDKNSGLRNRKIKIQFMYNFNDKISDIDREYVLNENNSVEIPFLEIPNLEKLASFRVEYQLNVNEKRFGYITENKITNLKEKDIPNIIEIEFVEIPNKEIVYRTTLGRIKDRKLEIISSDKTKTTLPDYFDEIAFEKYYEIQEVN